MPDETTILRFRHPLEKHDIGVDAESGLVHTVVGTAANAHDVTQAAQLLHGEEYSTDISQYLHFSRERLNTVICISSTGNLQASGSDFDQ